MLCMDERRARDLRIVEATNMSSNLIALHTKTIGSLSQWALHAQWIRIDSCTKFSCIFCFISVYAIMLIAMQR
jgi:hypothetical protein